MPKGGAKPGERRGGRKAGTPNKVTTDVRAAIALIAERNVERVEGWLAEVDDPAKRVDLFLRLIEYHVPKLARSELTGPDGGPMQVHVNDPTRRANRPTE